MKNFMKKIIYVMALGILFLASAGQASAAWNTYPSDCPQPLTIGNYTTGEGIQDGSNGCWTRKSVSASSGQTINVAVYYDNTNNANANNVVINLNQSPAGSMSTTNSSYSFSGNLTSSVGSLSLSQVTANLSSSQTLTFSQAKWFKKASTSGVSLPSGQTGYEAFNGGLSMGTIADGDWGTIIFSFSVGSTVEPQLCKDTSAINYNGDLPCRYAEQLCKDTSAINYNGTLPCRYAEQLCKDTSASNYNQPLPCVWTPVKNYCKITRFDASDTSIDKGDSVKITWDTDYCNSVYISGLGNVQASGSRSFTLNSDRNFTINASGTYGSDSDSVTVSVNDNNDNDCKITNFDADDTSIEEGDSVDLEWDTTDGCDYVNITGVKNGLDTSDSYSVRPTSTRTYTLYAYGNGGSDTETVKIYVDDNNNDQNTCYVNSFTASNTRINAGGTTNLRWDTEDCTSVSISYLGNVRTSSNQTVQPINNTNYILTAYGSNGGVQTRSVYVSVIPLIIPPQPVNSCAVTTVATNIGQSTAQLNGIVSGNTGVSTYFEYGTSVNLGQRTVSKYSTNANFSDFVSGLSPNTIYYFRMIADCQGGMSQGSIEIFRTVANTVVKQQVIVQGTTVVGTASPIMLNISNRYELIAEGDLVDYVVTYKNIGKVKLFKPMVQVILPMNITLVNASTGSYSVDTHTLSAPIKDLAAGEEGVIYLQGRVDSIPLNNSKIATTAILIYTSANGSQENAMAYVLNVPKISGIVLGTEDSVLGGSAMFGGLLSIGLIGWLLIILIIMLLILIVRSVYSRTSDSITHTTTTTHH